MTSQSQPPFYNASKHKFQFHLSSSWHLLHTSPIPFYRTIQLCRMAVKNEHRGNALQLGIMSSSSSCHQPVHACGNRGTQIKRQILWHKIWILNTDPLCMPQVATVRYRNPHACIRQKLSSHHLLWIYLRHVPIHGNYWCTKLNLN